MFVFYVYVLSKVLGKVRLGSNNIVILQQTWLIFDNLKKLSNSISTKFTLYYRPLPLIVTLILSLTLVATKALTQPPSVSLIPSPTLVATEALTQPPSATLIPSPTLVATEALTLPLC